MKRYNLICVAVAALILAVVINPVFSQEGQQPTTNETVETSPAKENMSQAEEISIYGEVKSVNPSLSTITLQYYNYDTDEEKTIEIVSGKDTKIENITSLNDLKQGDWVDVAYSMSNGKNMAKSIKVEKKEEENAEETSPQKTPGESMPKE